jgi:hypothetical protein
VGKEGLGFIGSRHVGLTCHMRSRG